MRATAEGVLLVLALTSLAAATPAQVPEVIWARAVGGRGYDMGGSVEQADGGYVMAGWTDSFGAGYEDVYLVKTDDQGRVQWTKTYGGSDADYGYVIRRCPDGGYVIAGETFSFSPGGGDAYLVKTDASGESEWTRTYGGIDYDFATAVDVTPDSGHILAGGTFSFGTGECDVYLVKTDARGQTQWERAFRGPWQQLAQSVRSIADGGYVVTGVSVASDTSASEILLMKVDRSGNEIWTRRFAPPGCQAAGYDVEQTADAGFVVAGAVAPASATTADLYLVRTDAAGYILWTKVYGGPGEDDGFSVQRTREGGFVVAGAITQQATGTDVWVIGTDLNGDSLWSVACGGPATDVGFSARQTADGGYIVAGRTWSVGSGECDAWLIRLSPFLGIEETPPRQRQPVELRAVPNPFRRNVRVICFLPFNGPNRIVISNAVGQELRVLRHEAQPSGWHALEWDGKDDEGRDVPPGVYFLRLTTPNSLRVHKLLRLH